MSQQELVTMPNGSIYKFDYGDFQYHCTHTNVIIKEVEVDTTRKGEHDTYQQFVAICDNPECKQEFEDYDFSHLE